MDAQALGRYLRETREAKELTLEDAERALRIRQRILESFELGEFTLADASTVQIRGFIRNYARYLGLDEDRIIAYYEAARQEAELPRRKNGKRRTGEYATVAPTAPRRITDTNPSLPAVPVVTDRPPRQSNFLNTLVLLLVAGAALAVIVFVVVQLVGQPQNNPAADPAGVEILGNLPASPSYTPVPTLTPAPTLTPILGVQQNYNGQGILVTMAFTQRTWLRVLTDGIEQYVGIAVPGQTPLEYSARESVTVTASNAEALEVIWNGQPQPVFGGRGQKVDIVFGLDNVQISSGPDFDPTSEFTPTPVPTSHIDVGAAIAALTPTVTPGPSPTPTLTPSVTPTPSDTPTITPTPSNTPTETNTPTLTRTPTITPTPTFTLTPSPTAILPPRVTQEGLPPTKEITSP
jgi:transcriptional regulator with XRE-family HTH domain